MIRLYIIFTILLSTFALYGQQDCFYSPTEFIDTEVKWRHLVVDSSLVGVVDTGFFANIYDGHNHINLEFNESFIHNGFLYSISETTLDNDYSGVLAEKIKLTNGKLIWQIKHDRRFTPYREKVLDYRIDGDEFIINGIRESIDDREEGDNMAFSAKVKGKIFQRIYNDSTGELISYFTPPQNDTLAVDVSFLRTLYYNYFGENEIENFLDARNIVHDSGYYLIKRIIDSKNGHRIGPLDTLVVGRFSNRKHSESIAARGIRFSKLPNGNFIHLEQYAPLPGYDHSYEAILTEYDSDFNAIKELDVKSLGFDTLDNITIGKVTEDYILLDGWKSSQKEEKHFGLVLDYDFNLLQKIDLIDPYGKPIYLDLPYFIDESGYSGSLLFYYRDRYDDYYWGISLAQSSSEGKIETFKTLQLEEQYRAPKIKGMIRLDNGDYLISVATICFGPIQYKYKEYREWLYIEKSQLVHTTEDIISSELFALYPNPTSHSLIIESQESLNGIVSVYDSFGQKITEPQNIIGKSIIVNLKDLKSGNYILQYVSHKGEIQVLTFIKI